MKEKEKIECLTLTVCIEDEAGKPVPDCEAQFRIHGGYATGWWPLGEKGEASHQIYETKVTSYVDIRGDKFQTLKRMGSGIDEDTSIVFVLCKCI